MTETTWTDETEKAYRKWFKERFGEYPPEVNLPKKEENKMVGPGLPDPHKLKNTMHFSEAIELAGRKEKERS